MSIVIVGSNHVNTSLFYTTINCDASVLITKTDQQFDVGHTSPQDLSLSDLEQVMSTADQVYWAFPTITEFNNKVLYYEFLEWLKVYQYKHFNIVNFDSIVPDPYQWNQGPRQITIDRSTVVYLGASTAAAAGIDIEHHYSTLVSQALGKQTLNLAQVASNIDRVFETFLTLSWSPGAVAVVQIPPLYKFCYCKQDNIIVDVHLEYHNPDLKNKIKYITEVYDQQHLFYHALKKIEAMIAIARANKVKLVFWLDSYKDEKTFSVENQMCFYQYPEFVPATSLLGYPCDFGHDGHHPGQLSNRILADAILKQLEQVNK